MRLWTWMLMGLLASGLAGCGGGGESPVPDDATTDQPNIEMGTPDEGTTTDDGSATTTDPDSEAPAFDPKSEAPAFDPGSKAPASGAGDAAASPASGESGGTAGEGTKVPAAGDSSAAGPPDREDERTAGSAAPVAVLLSQLADAAAREEVTAKLQGRGAATMPELLAALDDSDWHVRAGAVFALSLLGQEAHEALPRLRSLAASEQQESVRDAAAWAIDAIAQNPDPDPAPAGP